MTKKQKKVFLAIGAACLVLGAVFGWAIKSFLASQPPSAAVFAPLEAVRPDEGIVTALAGESFVLRDGTWTALEIGGRVRAGDTVKIAGSGLAEIQFGRLAVVRLRRNSSASFSRVSAATEGELTARLISGTALFRVRRESGRVKVETDAGTLNVVGTEFLVGGSAGSTRVAVKEGRVAFEGGTEAAAGYGVRFGAGAPGTPEALTLSGSEELKEIDRLRSLELPDTGIPRMARVVVDTAPNDALILLDGFVAGRGSSSLLVPYGETLKFSVAKTGYKTRSLEIPVVSAEAEKRYIVRLELDPSANVEAETEGIEEVLLLESRIAALEGEIESREVMFQALSGKSGSFGAETDRLRREADAARRETAAARAETEAARRRIAELEAQAATLSAGLEAERERVKQALELLQDKK